MKNLFARLTPICALSTLLLFTACGNNPVDDDEHEHAEVEAMVLVSDGVELFRSSEDDASLGTLTLGVGEQTGEIEVVFLDHDGDEIHMHDLEEEFIFGWTGIDATVASIDQLEAEEPTIVIEGIGAGTTTVRIGLLHGEHFDFSRDLTIVVE